MAIVDFEQDQDAPFGFGNFRDESGKITYAADPDTARQFVKTMKGSGAAKVADESTAIAKQVMGGAAPTPGPDMRLAQNAPLPGAPAPNSGQAATQGINQINAATASLEQKLDAQPTGGAPPTGKGAALVSQLNTVSPGPGSPAGAPGGAPTGKGAALVNAVSSVTPAAPTAAPSLPPISGVTDTHSSSVVKGASRAGVQARINADDKRQNALEGQMLDAAQGKDERVAAAINNESDAVKAMGAEEFANIDEARRKEAQAAQYEAAKREELKKNDESLDPDRVMRNMSTGKKIGMIILAALNGGFGALIGQKSNGVMDTIDREIERDIDRQKQEIASGRIRIGNEIDKYVKQGFDAQTAERLARDRMKAAIGKVTELESKRLLVEGENEENAKMMIAQNQAQRARWQGDLWATTEDRVQTNNQTTVQREVPKPVAATAGADAAMKELELQLKGMQVLNERNKLKGANERNAEIFGVDDNGAPKRNLTADQWKDVDDKIATVGPALAETAGAVNMTRELIKAAGGTLDETTGKITWPTTTEKVDGKDTEKPGDLAGVGPADARGGYTGTFTYPFRKAGLYRADVDKVRDAQDALQQYVTSQLTGANSSLKQDKVFGAMIGGDLENEGRFRENVEAWTRTLYANREAHLTRLGPTAQEVYYRNQGRAREGNQADVPTARPPQAAPYEQPPAAPAPVPGVPPPTPRQPQPTVASR